MFPGAPLLLSALTPTAYATAREKIPEADAVMYFPLDHPLILHRVLLRIRPVSVFLHGNGNVAELVVDPGAAKNPHLLGERSLLFPSAESLPFLEPVVSSRLSKHYSMLYANERGWGAVSRRWSLPGKGRGHWKLQVRRYQHGR